MSLRTSAVILAFGAVCVPAVASASEWPTLDPQPAACTAQPPGAGTWCTWFNAQNPAGQVRDGLHYPAGSYWNQEACDAVVREKVAVGSQWDRGFCGTTTVTGTQYYRYYNVYLRAR
jgi:hypothetical protein